MPPHHVRTAHFSTTRTALVALTTSALLALAACGKGAEAPATVDVNAPATGTAAAPAGEARTGQQATAKLNAYTAGYNKLIGTFGLPETQERYFKANIPARKATDSVSITDGWVDQGLEQFKQGRALPAGGLEALDTAADQLITPLDKLVTQLKALDVYYSSKAYKDDNLAKGKAQDAELRQLFTSTTAALKNFNTALGVEQKKRGAEALASLKASGDMLSYDTQLALQKGEELISVFTDEADIGNPAKYQQADALVATLEATLADQRTQYNAAKAKKPAPDYGHESANGSLVSLVGAYREMKQSKKASDYNSMVKYYNSAVESGNRISR